MTPKELVGLFAHISGLKTNHCGFNSDGTIEFDGFNIDGSRFHIQSQPISNPEQETKRLAILQKNRVLEAVSQAINYGESPMSDGTDIKAIIAKAKARKASAVESIIQAAADVGSAVDAVEDAAKKLEAEAVDLQQSVAEITNGGPG